jgi:uncharacterized protein
LKSKEYILEFNKVHKGLNEYTYIVDDVFLFNVEGAAIEKANVSVTLQVFKANEMYELSFTFKGFVQCECDVCLEDFLMPVDSQYKLLIKVSEAENYEDDEIVYITEKVIDFDLSHYLYESIMVSIPTRRVCEMGGVKECNKEVIKKLEELNSLDIENEAENVNPTWDKLKNIFK